MNNQSIFTHDNINFGKRNTQDNKYTTQNMSLKTGGRSDLHDPEYLDTQIDSNFQKFLDMRNSSSDKLSQL